MAQKKKHRSIKFFLSIILPTLLAIALSFGSIYFIVIPAFQANFLQSKKDMIRQLTNVAWNILDYYAMEEKAGRISPIQSRMQAMEEIRHLRYGTNNKDYFFIIDNSLKMVMHPYSSELEGKNLQDYRDGNGNTIFADMVKLVEQEESGYLTYTWQTKYDSRQSVAKLSYVQKFNYFGWVVGTGVFLDDVEDKMDEITRNLYLMAFLAVFLFTLLLLFIAQQSFRIEKKRRNAEDDLRLSHEKYKAMVESTTDPMLLIHQESCIYSNHSICTLLGYSQNELDGFPPRSLLALECGEHESGEQLLVEVEQTHAEKVSGKGILKTKEGKNIHVELSLSAIELGQQRAIILIAKDTHHSTMNDSQPAQLFTTFENIVHHLHIGLLQISGRETLRLVRASETSLSLLGLQSEDLDEDIEFKDFFHDHNQLQQLQEKLSSHPNVKDFDVWLRRKGANRPSLFNLSLIGRFNPHGEIDIFDGILEELTEKSKGDQERENLIIELQTSLLFLNQPIKYSLKDFVSCDLNTSIAQATRIMAGAKRSSILVSGDSGEMIGIITDMVLRERVIAENLPYDTPVYKVMSSPLIYIDDSALIFEAVLLMQEKGIKHLVVKNSAGKTISIISNEELLHVHRYSTAFMLSQIREAKNFEELLVPQTKVPRIVKSLTDSGAHAKNITRIITSISDAMLEKIIDFTIEEMGEPPARFAFISLGSEGRGEQTLVTDQDNGLIFEDVEGREEEIRAFFLSFCEKICTCLDKAGYDFCEGEIMAMNPKWCQPLSTWKDYFSKWVGKGSPQDLLEVSIFFDFRCIYGDLSFTRELREHLTRLVEARGVFLQHLAKTTISFKPPLDFFGNIHAENEDGRNSFDIKRVITAIVGFARLYAIQEALESVGTMQRIEELLSKGVINQATYNEIVEAYDHLMKLRFRHQVNMIDEGKTPDNHVDIDSLSHLDKVMLKKAFSQVSSIQKRLSYDFSGVA